MEENKFLPFNMNNLSKGELDIPSNIEPVSEFEESQKKLWVELRKDMLSMVATIERTYGMRRSIRCPHCGHKMDKMESDSR